MLGFSNQLFQLSAVSWVANRWASELMQINRRFRLQVELKHSLTSRSSTDSKSFKNTSRQRGWESERELVTIHERRLILMLFDVVRLYLLLCFSNLIQSKFIYKAHLTGGQFRGSETVVLVWVEWWHQGRVKQKKCLHFNHCPPGCDHHKWGKGYKRLTTQSAFHSTHTQMTSGSNKCLSS